MTFKFPCSGCGQRVSATEDFIGTMANCPACGLEMLVEAPVEERRPTVAIQPPPIPPPRAAPPPMPVQAALRTADVPNYPVGLGGWLFFVGFGLFATIARLGFLMLTQILPVTAPDVWRKMTLPGGELYHPLMEPLLILELVGNTVMMLFAAALLVFYFMRSHYFPRLMIGFWIVNVVFVLADLLLGRQVPLVLKQMDAAMMTEAIRTAIAALIWIPYFLVSKRVKATFVD